jgi:hypothetical protein
MQPCCPTYGAAKTAVYVQRMNCAERVACHVNRESRAIAGGATAVTRNLPRPRSLDPDFTDWDPEDTDTWDERIVMVADDEDFLEWQRDRLTDNN